MALASSPGMYMRDERPGDYLPRSWRDSAGERSSTRSMGCHLRGPNQRRCSLPDFKVHTVESAPEGSRAWMRGLHEQIGFVPNLAASMAEAPALLEAFVTLQTIGHRTSLSPLERQVIAVAVATETGCTYCVAAHSTFALKSGAEGAVVDAVRARTPLGDARLGAL